MKRIILIVVMTIVSVFFLLGNVYAAPSLTSSNFTEINKLSTTGIKTAREKEIITLNNKEKNKKLFPKSQTLTQVKKNPEVKKEAINENKEIIRALIRHLNDANPAVRKAAFKALRKIGKPAQPQLIAALKYNRNPIVRMQAAKLLGLITSFYTSQKRTSS